MTPFQPSLTTVAVCGSTGTQGLSVVRTLSSLGFHIRALTRDPKAEKMVAAFQGLMNVTPTAFDISDVTSVEQAFEGVDVVFAVTIPDAKDFVGFGETEGSLSELEQGKRMVDVAKSGAHDAGPPKYQSLSTFRDKAKVDEYLREVGLPHVVLRLGSFCENATTYHLLAPSPDDANDLTLSIPHLSLTEKTLPLIWVDADLGRLVALVLEQPEAFVKLDTPLAVAHSYLSGGDMTEALSQAIGKTVTLDSSAKFSGSGYDEMYRIFGDPAHPYFEVDTLEVTHGFLKSLGFEFHSYADFAHQKLAPAFS